MDIIVNKLDLIDDVKGVILEYCYDKRGYTYQQLQKMDLEFYNHVLERIQTISPECIQKIAQKY